MKGQIIRSGKRDFQVLLVEQKTEVTALALANLIKAKGSHLVVGDFVEVECEAEKFIITALHPRKNQIGRRLPRTNEIKVIAANCDLVMIVVSCSKPLYKRGLYERYQLRSKSWGIPSIVIFNKSDERDENFNVQREQEYLHYFDVDSFLISAKLKMDKMSDKKNDEAFSKLKDFLKNKTSIVVGPSGTGKSKLLSALSNGKCELLSGELAKVGKGAHTTTWAELKIFDQIKIIDSPGIRSFAVDDLSIEDIEKGFEEIERLAKNCQFKDCSHQENTKGCYFRTLDEKLQEDQFLLERLHHFLNLKAEITKTPQWQKNK